MRIRFAATIAALFTAFLIALPCLPARADARVALVIGNGDYQHLPHLRNPPNDARDLAGALKKLDFDVDLGVDLPLADMQRKVTAFAKRAQTADVALAFFAGHGVQAADPLGSTHPVNYLLPIDADIKEEADLGFMMTARDILARLQAAGSVRILILDACRDNPIPQRLARGGRGAALPRGLGPEPKTGGTLIAYSTQPGTVADDGDAGNSPFVKALLAHIADPGLDIRLLFADVRREVVKLSNGAQTPETSDSLEGRFAFNAAPSAVAMAPEAPSIKPPLPQIAPAAPAGLPADEVAWSIVRDTREAEELHRFIKQYPASARRADAEARLKALEPTHVAAIVPVRPAETVRPAPAPCGGITLASLPSRAAAPLSAAEECSLHPPDSFRECAGCPEMVVVPPGTFTMGSPELERGRLDSESPQHVVRIARPFAVGRTHVTVNQFAAFVAETGYNAGARCDGGGAQAGSWLSPGFAQDPDHPAVCIDWNDAKAYVDWLAGKTGKPYRLPAESEWEYASRGRTSPGVYPRLWFGADEFNICRYGNGLDLRARGILWRGLQVLQGVMPCNDGYLYTAPAGHYAPNAFGLHDMFGNARQWTADCWHPSYAGAPADGSAWASPGPCAHVIRGGAWSTIMRELRAASRYPGQAVDNTYGFRVARTLVTEGR